MNELGWIMLVAIVVLAFTAWGITGVAWAARGFMVFLILGANAAAKKKS